MFLTEFAEQRNVKANTISAYINKHKEEFIGHTSTRNKKLFLDDVAEKILSEKYPLPMSVADLSAVHELEETKIQLELANERIIALQEELLRAKDMIIDISPKLAKAELNQLLLEQSESEKKELQGAYRLLEEEKTAIQARINDFIISEKEMSENKELLHIKLTEKEEELQKVKEELGNYRPSIFGLYKKIK